MFKRKNKFHKSSRNYFNYYWNYFIKLFLRFNYRKIYY